MLAGNGPQGTGNHFTKLTEIDVIKIRLLLKDNPIKTRIAEKFNVCLTTISNIESKKTWSHI